MNELAKIGLGNVRAALGQDFAERAFIDEPGGWGAHRTVHFHGYSFRPPSPNFPPAYSFRSLHGAPGLGASGASDFTVAAAKRIDQILATTGCVGCDTLTSDLRQATLAFKAACLTDPLIRPLVSLNVATPLAMTGFGPGSNDALTLVLGAARTYQGGPCTDSDGNCTAALPQVPAIPPALAAAGAAVGAQILQTIQAAMSGTTQAQQSQQQPGLVAQLTQLAKSVLEQIQAAMPKPAAPITPATPAPSSTPAPEAAATKPFPATQVIIGGLIGAAVIGGIALAVHASKKKKHA